MQSYIFPADADTINHLSLSLYYNTFSGFVVINFKSICEEYVYLTSLSGALLSY